MKRSHEKIKDIVDAQPYDQIQNYPADLRRALGAYRFTDVTSILVADWLDTLANLPKNRGASRALAGVRGVGKSHTLAVFAALAAYPESRNSVSDSHVGTSARRLLSRRFQVVRAERGTRQTLLQELKAGFAEAVGGSESDWPDDPSAILAIAASRIAETPIILVVDTAFGREAHVRRDDGPVLTQLAKAVQEINVFVALALDDDIEGAEGVNASLASAFHIDYLDPEHLYRIADRHLFQKTAQSRSALHEMYMTLRSLIPDFNWSEPRFASIYPVHPMVADVAAAVRLYAPSFAFLPFAASAVARSTNRPAQSLIALDEVFDRCDVEMRKAEELDEAFVAYDKLSTENIAQFPIMQRLQAKLVLKALFILSLDGRGATSRELAAAMLFYDEKSPGTALKIVEEMLGKFADSSLEGAVQRSLESGESRYRFRILVSAGFDTALAARTSELLISDLAIFVQLRNIARTRFSDWPFGSEVLHAVDVTRFPILWRGTARFGRLVWQSSEEGVGSLAAPPSRNEIDDWEIIALPPGVPPGNLSHAGSIQRNSNATSAHSLGVWQPDALTEDEKESLRRLITLRTDSSIMTEFGETARAAERTHTALAERCFARVYIDDARLVMGDVQRSFTVEARSTNSLTEMLGFMLSPLLGVRYPQHPLFTGTLSEQEVATLVGGLFGGANPNDARVQSLAEAFALPLGLVSIRSGAFALEAGDQVLKQPWVRQVLAMTDAAGGELVSLGDIYLRLRAEPYGLQREAQQLILAALVAQRRIELITDTNDRITRRTLDQRLRWDEITGIVRASELLHSSEELSGWARLLTGNMNLGSISEPGARGIVRAALWDWLNAWRAGNPLDSFSSLPDAGLTTRTWNLAASVRKSFGTASEAVEDALADNISLEEGLQRVADAFGDSAETFADRTKLLGDLTGLTVGIGGREFARSYLYGAEPTGIGELESARRELMEIASDVHSLLSIDSNRRFDVLWKEFRTRYADHYSRLHETTVGGSIDHGALNSLLNSADWHSFRSLSALSIVNKGYWEEAKRLLDTAIRTRCDLPVRRLLEKEPYCACGFRLARSRSLSQLVSTLNEIMQQGISAHLQTLALWGRNLAHALNVIAEQQTNDAARDEALRLAASLAQGNNDFEYCQKDIDLIEQALRSGGVPPIRIEVPAEVSGLLTREELRARLTQWIDTLPDYPALVDVTNARS